MKNRKPSLTLAVGSAFALSLTALPNVQAADNPFGMQALQQGYLLADAKTPEGKCGEGKCGGKKKTDGKAAEGKCGGAKSDAKMPEGKCGGARKEDKK